MSTLSTSEAPTMMGTSRSPSPEGSIPKMVRVSKLDPVTDFGARLAIARNLCPDEALLAPPSQATTPTAEGGLSLLPAETPLIRGAEAFRQRPVYGSVKGSYTSPYDSGGKAPGDKHLPSWSTTMEEFEAKYGSRSRRALQKTGSGGNAESDHAVSSAPAIEPKKVAPTVPEGAKDRVLFRGPLAIMRHECTNKKDSNPAMKALGEWIDDKMPESLWKVHDRDQMLPQVIYSIKVPMNDEDWFNYNQALAHFEQARNLHNELTRGKHELDQMTKFHKDAADQLTWPQLTVPNHTLELMLAGMVKQHSLGQPWDWGKPVGNRPELRPVEYGGTLRNYFPSE